MKVNLLKIECVEIHTKQNTSFHLPNGTETIMTHTHKIFIIHSNNKLLI